ncbi:TadE/TadG family type IV pilus assembly protein [Thermostilla marina]
MRRRHSYRSRSRRGSLTLQMVLILPILLLVSLAILQFGILMTVEQSVTHAATVAAREAAKGADAEAVAASVEEVLSLHGLTIGDALSVVIEDPSASDPVVSRGNLACEPPNTDLDAGLVRATVCVELSRRPFLNALRCFAVDFTGRRFTVSAVAPREFEGDPESTRRPNCGCN